MLLLFGGYFFVLPPRVIAVYPEGSDNVPLDSKLAIKFNKPIKRQEIKYLISPEAYGEWKFEDPLLEKHLFRTLVFIPAMDFDSDTSYEVKLEDIKGFGISGQNDFSFSFKTKVADISLSPEVKAEEEESPPMPEITQPALPEKKVEIKKTEVKPKTEMTLLKIAVDWQDDPLSCEAASLKMALAYKGVSVSEKAIMDKIGYDPTPHRGNIWGDPYESYVGDIRGQMCSTGYGVYWEPVAKAAKNWRTSESFSGWKIEDLIREIKAGNPIVFWGVLPTGTLTNCSWSTSEGKYVMAYKEDHVRLVVGFIGSSTNPTKIIINDPLSGRLYWSTDYFLQNWKAFNYSGVVIR